MVVWCDPQYSYTVQMMCFKVSIQCKTRDSKWRWRSAVGQDISIEAWGGMRMGWISCLAVVIPIESRYYCIDRSHCTVAWQVSRPVALYGPTDRQDVQYQQIPHMNHNHCPPMQLLLVIRHRSRTDRKGMSGGEIGEEPKYVYELRRDINLHPN